MSEATPVSSPIPTLSDYGRTSLLLYLTSALSTPQEWKEKTIQVEQLPQPVNLSLKRENCTTWLNKELSRLENLEPKFYESVKDWRENPESLKRLQQYYYKQNNIDPLLASQYQRKLDSLAGEEKVVLPSQKTLSEASIAKKNLHALLGEKIEKSVSTHLQNYSPEQRAWFEQRISGHVQKRVVDRIQHQEAVGPELVQQTLIEICQNPHFGAALTQKGELAEELKTSLSQLTEEDKAKIIENAKQLEEFQKQIATSRSLGFPKVSSKAKKLAEKIDKKGYEQATQAFIRGYTADEITKGWNNPRLAQQVKELEKEIVAPKSFFDRGHQANAYRAHQKVLTKRKKTYEWEKFKRTSKRGWLVAPRMRLGMVLNRSATWQKISNFAPKLTPGYWVAKAAEKTGLTSAWRTWGRKVALFKEDHALGWLLAPKMRLKRAIGNWLRKKLKHEAANALIGGGIKGIAKHAFVKGLTAIGLGSAAGPIGTAIGIAVTAATVLSNKEIRKKIFELARAGLQGVIYGIKYLFSQSPLAATLGIFGFIIGGPPGALVGSLIGLGIDKLVGGVKGAFGFGSKVGETAAALPLDTTVKATFAEGLGFNLTTMPIIVPGVVAGTSFFVFMTLSSAFFIPGETAPGTPPQTYGSEYVDIAKTCNFEGSGGKIDNNNLPQEIGCQITVVSTTDEKTTLNNVKVSDALALRGQIGQKKIKDLSWEVGSLNSGESWTSEEYKIKATKGEKEGEWDFRNSLLFNNARVEATVVDEKGKVIETTSNRTSYSIPIGDAPVPDSVTLANQIINILNSCPGLAKTEYLSANGGRIVTTQNWSLVEGCLQDQGIEESVIAGLNPYNCPYKDQETGVYGPDKLQCTCFVSAVTGLNKENSASDYCEKKDEYNVRADWENLQEGDIVATAEGWGGHVALVAKRDGDLLELIEAIGTTGGVGRRGEDQASIETLKRLNYCGFIRP